MGLKRLQAAGVGLQALRRWLYVLSQSRSGQCSPALRADETCRSEGDAIVIAREQAPLTHRR